MIRLISPLVMLLMLVAPSGILLAWHAPSP